MPNRSMTERYRLHILRFSLPRKSSTRPVSSSQPAATYDNDGQLCRVVDWPVSMLEQNISIVLSSAVRSPSWMVVELVGNIS